MEMSNIMISFRYRRENLKLLWMIFLSVLLFSGCSISKEKEKTITVMWWGDIYNRAFAQKVIDRYNGKNPAVKVKLLAIEQAGGAYESKILTMSAAGISPDIILVTSGKGTDYASKEIFLSLDRYKTDPEFTAIKKDMWTNILDGCRYNGKLYYVPIWTNSIGIFYNKALFDKAGVPYPTSDWDFDELLDKAKRLTFDFNNDGRIDQFGFGGFPLSFGKWEIPMLIEAFGGHLYSEDGEECLINTPEAIRAIQWAIDLSVKHHVCPTFQEIRSGGNIASLSGQDYFRTGKVAMIFWGRWYLDTLRQSKNLDWAVAPYPRGDKKVMFQSPVCLAISSKTKHPDECWNFLKFVMGKEGQTLISQNRSDIPVVKSMAYSQDFLNYSERPDANKIFLEMLEYAEPARLIVGTTEWEKNARDKFELAVFGKMSFEEACNQIAKEYRNVIKK